MCREKREPKEPSSYQEEISSALHLRLGPINNSFRTAHSRGFNPRSRNNARPRALPEPRAQAKGMIASEATESVHHHGVTALRIKPASNTQER